MLTLPQRLDIFGKVSLLTTHYSLLVMPFADVIWTDYTPLALAGQDLGFVHKLTLPVLRQSPYIKSNGEKLELAPDAETFESRTKAIAAILKLLLDAKILNKEKRELYAVGAAFDDAPVALADRCLMPVLGFKAHGIHCNAYVQEKGELKLWTARRSLSASVDPGKLDHLVAGGQPYGLSLRENLAKEAWEEAGIPAELVAPATAHGSISYSKANWEGGHINGVRRDTLFVFDLELPLSFTPTSMDGESGDFHLLSIAEVKKQLAAGAYKFNVPLVIEDFLKRRGL